jgi:hypothetical protein
MGTCECSGGADYPSPSSPVGANSWRAGAVSRFGRVERLDGGMVCAGYSCRDAVQIRGGSAIIDPLTAGFADCAGLTNALVGGLGT